MFSLNNNFQVEWRILEELRLRGRFGVTISQDETTVFHSPDETSFAEMDRLKRGSYSKTSTRNTSYDGSIDLTYGRTFGEHMINLIGGMQFTESNSDTEIFSAEGYMSDQYSNPNFSMGYPDGGKPSSTVVKSRTASYYFNLNYGYDMRYLVDLNLRTDGASVFGINNPLTIEAMQKLVPETSSLKGINNLVCGANEADFHCTGLNIERDCGNVDYVDVAKIYAGAVCPVCGKPVIDISRGIEVGNIFQLGTKYTESMDMTYLDADGVAKHPIMGCYGIGVGRLAASICQESHDDYGPIWPMSIAPWQVEICNLRCDDETVTAVAGNLYDELAEKGIEVLYDDRDIRPGAMFADADLFGIPVRVVVSPKTCANGVVEVSMRDKSLKTDFSIENAAEEIANIVKAELAKYDI